MNTTAVPQTFLTEARDLATFITGFTGSLPRDECRVLYIRDQDGNDITDARVERETLSDGSHVYNLVLTVSR